MSTGPADLEPLLPGPARPATIPEPRPTRWKANLLRAVRWFWVISAFLFVAFMVLMLLPLKQKHLSITHDFGIGFDLSPSYGTVAVSYPNGSIYPIARVEGSAAYREMMIRLSLPSSQHLHKPYEDVSESMGDISRQLWRTMRRKLFLPASRDVGTLAVMLRALRRQASSFVGGGGEPISAAVVSIPHLAALYGEDLYDAFDFLSLLPLKTHPYWDLRPVQAAMAAYAGNGRGLCRDYRNATACRAEEEEEGKGPLRHALAVGYTRTSLTASLARVGWAYGDVEEFPAREDLRLGFDARREGGPGYWARVRRVLRSPVVDGYIPRNVSMVVLFGDAAPEPEFRDVLGAVVDEVLGGPGRVEFVDREPEFSAAMGAAEMAKRVTYKLRNVEGTVPEF
ncbi:hypothetical protein SAMD00023353_7200360 [Rosellinia necatrix]|uniref:Uncharacterized protein n=1 Tax=Rosellinia necatrix TaxID=77044 RepID=A0A1W2TTL6_ROSNE|nr:hypothetical protein SAMD00023353_7200360 [Rosellinia necatrix]